MSEKEEKRRRQKRFSRKEKKTLSKQDNLFLTPSPRIIAPYAEATLARILLDLLLEFFKKRQRGERKKKVERESEPLFVFFFCRPLSPLEKKKKGEKRLLTPPP